MGDFLKAMFYVDGRVSLTKTGIAIKMFSVYVGGSISAVAFFQNNTGTATVIAVAFAAIAGIGSWIEEVGKRDAMTK